MKNKVFKEQLIKDTIARSKTDKKVVYGLINEKGCIQATSNEDIVKERLEDGYKVYCKARSGNMTL